MDTAIATITVQRITPIKNAGKLLALADVETVIDGVALVIRGVQVRADGDKTEIALPRYRELPDNGVRVQFSGIVPSSFADGSRLGLLAGRAIQPYP